MVSESLKLSETPSISSVSNKSSAYYLLKRLIDLMLSLLALIILIPINIILAILIRLDTPGPIIFKQKRVGSQRIRRNGNYEWITTEFICYKFRTMFADSDSDLHQKYIEAYINNDEDGMVEVQGDNTEVKKLINDPRITKVGRILRKTSLDELPQFWNIFRGDMSLVGPRPAIPYEIPLYKQWHLNRLQGKPGLTGLWQVTARCSTEFDEMVRLDIEYLENQSTRFDLIILMRTPFIVISGKGAH
jgi:lipopolysaccharide/colanic/teichoic acid biosynthesis glycosyltransferase